MLTRWTGLSGTCRIMQAADSFGDVHEVSSNASVIETKINPDRQRFPFCVVWTPLPVITYLFPVIGHMGIAMSSGVIKNFDAPYHVSEGKMAFGNPTKYWLLNPAKARGAVQGWDTAVTEASEVYKTRMVSRRLGVSEFVKWTYNSTKRELHNICCDNCHSHVGMALSLMEYDNTRNWNMAKLAFYMLKYGKYISFLAFLKTWLPFVIIVSVILTVSLIY